MVVVEREGRSADICVCVCVCVIDGHTARTPNI